MPIFVLLLALLLVGCGKSSPTGPDEVVTSSTTAVSSSSVVSSSSSVVAYRPPGISLVVFGEDGSTPALARTTVAATSSTTCSAVQSLRQCGSSSSTGGALPTPRTIYLGDTWNSTLNLFAIQNTGTVPLLGLKMRHSNPNFNSQPDSIPILGVPGDVYSDMMTILKVWVGHGTYSITNIKDRLLWNGLNGDGMVRDTLWFTWDTDTVGVKFILETRARVAAINQTGDVLLGNCQVAGLSPGDSIPPEVWDETGTMVISTTILTNDEGCLPGAGLNTQSQDNLWMFSTCAYWSQCNVQGY